MDFISVRTARRPGIGPIGLHVTKVANPEKRFANIRQIFNRTQLGQEDCAEK